MRRGVVGIALLLLLAGGVAFPGTPEDDFPLEGMARWGPFRVRPYYLVKDTGYDDNVFLDDVHPVSDFTSTAEAGIKLVTFFSNRAALQAEERLDYVWFAQTTSQNHFNNAFLAKANFYLKRITFFTDLQATSIKERPSTAEFDFRLRLDQRQFGAGVRYDRPRSSLEVRLGRDRIRYVSGIPEGESVALYQNRREDRLTVTGRKKLFPKTTFLLEWEARGIAFDDPLGQEKNSRARRVSAGVEFDPSAFLRGTVKVGVESLRPDLPQFDSFRGMVGEGALLYRVTNRTNLEGRGSRSTGFTIAPNNVFYVYSSYGATLTQFLTTRVAGEIGLDRQKVDYPELTEQYNIETGETATGFRTDKFYSYFVGASYRFSNLARVGLRFGKWRRTSTFGFLARRRNTAMVTYSYNF